MLHLMPCLAGVHFPRSTGVGNKSEDGPTGRKNNSLGNECACNLTEHVKVIIVWVDI